MLALQSRTPMGMTFTKSSRTSSFQLHDEREEMLLEGIQTVDLNKIRSNSGDKKTSGVDAENKLETIYINKYKINLDHQILTDHGAFYPQALYNVLTFELTIAPAAQVVRGFDTPKLVYKLKNTRSSGVNLWPMTQPVLTHMVRSLPTTILCEKKWLMSTEVQTFD